MTELYHPDETATGYLLTGIAEGLAHEFQVSVLCARPSKHSGYHLQENRHGVEIRRCLSTTLNKDVIMFRLINIVVVSMSILWNALWRVRRPDIVLVVTNPPTLPFVARVVCWLRKTKCLLLIHDVYPEVLVATGLVRKEALLTRFLSWLNSRLYKSVDRIVVLGRDMRELVKKKLSCEDRRVVIINNWADLDTVAPTLRSANSLLERLGLLEKFVLQYAGNIGRTHGIEFLLEAAKNLRNHERFHLLVIGSGARKKWLETSVQAASLSNVTVLPPQPRANQNIFLNACDVAIISFVSGMAGVSVPSRMYNIMASGKPIIAVTEPHSELGMIVSEEKIGWLVLPHDIEALTSAITMAMSRPELVRQMGIRARLLAERRYSYETAIKLYAQQLHMLSEP